MRLIPGIVLLFLVSSIGLCEDLVLVNGVVIDGTGKVRSSANIRVRDGKIADIGVFKPAATEMTLDVRGMIVAPGFVDFQTLSPSAIQKDPAAGGLSSQGVTTAVLGSDGSGPYSVEDFMFPFDEKPAAVNIAILVGHATIRRQILGADYKRAATAEELGRMSELVSDAMKQGAFGFASDLQQEPASYSSPEELLALAKVVAKFGGTILLRARDAKEPAVIARDAKVPVQVLNADQAALAEIDKARARKVDISADSYSYPQLVQDKALGLERAIQRMSSVPASRFGIRERGVLKKGAPADLVVFNPNALSSGMKYVFVNGAIALKDAVLTTARAGQALR
jgi:N-acyl-D-aspartate/D-glutamate deacylase